MAQRCTPVRKGKPQKGINQRVRPNLESCPLRNRTRSLTPLARPADELAFPAEVPKAGGLLDCLTACFADVPELKKDATRAAKLKKSGGCCES